MTTQLDSRDSSYEPGAAELLGELIAAVTARSDIQVLLNLIADVAEQMAFLANQNTHLQVALDTNRRVGIAVGILMTRHRVTDDAAFAMLRRASQENHCKLRDVVEDVVLTGELPTT